MTPAGYMLVISTYYFIFEISFSIYIFASIQVNDIDTNPHDCESFLYLIQNILHKHIKVYKQDFGVCIHVQKHLPNTLPPPTVVRLGLANNILLK